MHRITLRLPRQSVLYALLFLVTSTLPATMVRAATSGGTVRLIDQLLNSDIDSPLLRVSAASSLDDVGGSVETRPLLRLTFERFTPAAANWGRGAGCKAARRADGSGTALHYLGRNAHRCMFLIEAEPSSHYRVSRDIFTTDPEIDFRIIESSAALQYPGRINHTADVERVMKGRFVRMTKLLFVHQLPSSSVATWESGVTHIFTTPKTRSMVIILNDAEATVTGKNRQAWFDNLIVERLLPTPAQELALLKAYAPARHADQGLGIAKHGQLLPIGDVDRVVPPFDANFDFREALFAPAPTRLGFDLTPATNARLFFSVALLKMSRPGDAATFNIYVRPEGRATQKVFSRTIRIDEAGSQWHWFDERVDLSRFAGRRIHLTLETSAPESSRGYALWGSPTIDSPRRSNDPPNVLFIAVDTLRADHLSAYGYGRPTSPNIDRLARDGVLFSEAISPSNWTSPAFASLLTGLMPSRHRVVHRARALDSEIHTLAKHFRDNGWTTHGIAYKAYLYNMGFENGFDTFFNVPRHDARADDNVNQALRWLEDNGDRRFFMFLHFNDPHQPFNQPVDFARRFTPSSAIARFGLELPFVVGTNGDVVGCSRCVRNNEANSVFKAMARDLYDGEIAYVDDRIGRLISDLKKRGIYDDTVIAFVSDHGELMWDHGEYFGHGGPWMVDELIHVPLLIKPARRAGLAHGKIVDSQVRSFDLMPTLLDLAGINSSELEIEAQSLMPFLATQGRALAGDRVAISENIKQNILSVRHKGWKYVLSHPPGRPARERLYNLRTTAAEKVNVASRNPLTLEAMRLHAMRHLMRNHSGRYLLVTGDGMARSYKIRLKSAGDVRDAQTLFGLPLRRKGGRTLYTSEGRTAASIVMFARIDAPDDAVFDIAVTGSGSQPLWITRRLEPEAFVEFAAAAADRVRVGQRVALHAFGTHAEAKRPDQHQVSAQRLEILHAVGTVQ